MSYPAIALDQLGGIHPEVTFNEVTAAMGRMGLFGVKQRATQGLTFTVYGGRFPSTSGPLAIADQTVTLTASNTNYVYADAAGVVHVTTASPAGWPGPLASAARALYQLTVGANSITSGTCWNIGVGQPGATGPQGPTGPGGAEMWLTRKRIRQVQGFSTGSIFTSGNSPGFDDTTNINSGPTLQPADSSSFVTAICNAVCNPGTSAANTSEGIRSTGNLYTLGNAAGRGGFDISFRFGAVSTAVHTRSFVGLFDTSGGNPSASVDPSALLNIIGIGGDDGDANFQFMVNDGSGTATKTDLGSNFPQHAVGLNKCYEARFWANANASLVNFSVLNPETGDTASGNASSNIPAGTTFLGWLVYCNNGSGTSNAQISFMQVAGNSRY